MRITIGLLVILGLSGCASRVPKEKYRQIVLDTLAGEQNTVQNVNVQKSYELYGDRGTWSGRQIQRNVGYVKDFVDACESGIKSIKTLAAKPISPSFNVLELEDKSIPIKNEFKKYCTVGYDLKSTVAESVSIDFTSYQGKFQRRFDQYLLPIEKKIALHRQSENKIHKAKLAENERYKKSSAYMSDKMCEVVAIIAQANRRIQQENDGAKHSGFVDKNVMHKNGQRISIFTKQLETARKDYKKKFNKTWNPKSCN